MNSSKADYNWTTILLEAAREVRSRVRKALKEGAGLTVEELKNRLDSQAESAIEETLKRLGVSAHIVSEEAETVIGGEGDYIIVDPVDGTTNLARGIPISVTSMLVSKSRKLSDAMSALVMNLCTGESYKAELGRGAWLGGRRLTPAEPKPFGRAVISLDISKGSPLDHVAGIIAEANHIRQLGCSAFSLCLVAGGGMDAHIDLRGKLRATDAAAGLLILREAEGAYQIDGVEGGDLELTRQSKLNLVAASSKEMLDTILKHIS